MCPNSEQSHIELLIICGSKYYNKMMVSVHRTSSVSMSVSLIV